MILFTEYHEQQDGDTDGDHNDSAELTGLFDVQRSHVADAHKCKQCGIQIGEGAAVVFIKAHEDGHEDRGNGDGYALIHTAVFVGGVQYRVTIGKIEVGFR